MIHLRQPYTPDIYVSRPPRVSRLVAVGAEYEAVPEGPPFRGSPLTFAGALPGMAEGEKGAQTQWERGKSVV